MSARDLVLGFASRVASIELLLQLRWEASLRLRGALAGVDPRQRRLLAQIRRGGGRLKVNLGSGPLPRQGWLNVDGWSKAADLIQDLGRGLDLPDACAQLAFSEHVLEHLEYPRQARVFLREICRILEPGGHVRVIVPDAERLMRAYTADDREALKRLAPSETTPIEAVNRVFRERGFHRFAWDFDLLASELVGAGFQAVRRASFRDSPIDELNIDHDEPERILQSLYVEAQKPA